jgi:hypothetical protein
MEENIENLIKENIESAQVIANNIKTITNGTSDSSRVSQKELLKKVGEIVQKDKELSILKGENFNMFKIFDMERDENKMHSRFIELLLNPKGCHDRGTVFLELFLKEINQEKYFENLVNVRTKVEHFIGVKNIVEDNKEKSKNESTGGRIDIYLWDGKKSISIENKIDAPDQENQIIRYYNYKTDNNKVYYLTKKGEEPKNKGSFGNLISDLNENAKNPDFYCISYSETILNWVEKCQEEVSNNVVISGTIKQYINTIKRITGQLVNQEMEKKIENLIKENYSDAQIIANNLESIKIAEVSSFLDELEEKLKKEIINGWSILFDKEEGNKYRALRIVKGCINIGLQGQPFFWNNETRIGLSSKKGNEGLLKIWEELKLKKEYYNDFIKYDYPKKDEFWLFYRPIFNFGKIDDFTKLLQNDSRKKLIEEVTDEIISLTEVFDEIN